MSDSGGAASAGAYADEFAGNDQPWVCEALTKSGSRCSRRAVKGTRYCAQHAGRGAEIPSDIDARALYAVIGELASPRNLGEFAGSARDDIAQTLHMLLPLIERLRAMVLGSGLLDPNRAQNFASDTALALASTAAAISKRLQGNYTEDDFGFDETFTNAMLPVLELLYTYYWRVDTEGLDNVPAAGGAMLVSNHAGSGLPFDGAMIKTAMLRNHPAHRHVRILVLDWLMGLPWLANLMRTTGQVLACSENADELLRRDQLVAVFPEGVKGMAKPFSQRYNLQRFGRGGFVRIALKAGAPIVPVAVVGSEEIYPKIGNLPLVNRLIGAPFVPMTPTFPWLGLAGAIPLPSKWHIEFCEPIETKEFGPAAADDRVFVLELGERIRTTIQKRLHANLLKRSTPFW